MIPPAQLWVGASAHLQQQLIPYLQSVICQQHGCSTCVTCRHIALQQHHAVCWVLPEKNQYSKADCEIIAHKSSFMLEPGEQFFFIIPYAELLTPASANSLLKLVEEPPQGYHFIFCAERPGMLLPTIVSRCVVMTHASETAEPISAQFLQLFKDPQPSALPTFSKNYEAAAVTEQMTPALLDELLHQLHEEYRAAVQTGDTHCAAFQIKIDCIQKAYAQLPMPGSAKLFWRNLFLKMLSV